MKTLLLLFTLFLLTSCSNHRLANYDVGASIGRTEFSGDTDTKSAFTAIGKVNLHFEVK